MASQKIQETTNYRLFHRNEGENRPLDRRKHRKLEESMQRYGFLWYFPIVCFRAGDGKLVIKDGQHRFILAESLGLPVWWVEADVDFDVAVINCTAKIWGLRDYARKHAFNGLAPYQEVIDFSEKHRLPLGTAAALLAGTTSFANCQEQFLDGTFRVKDRAWADAVAGIYGPLTLLSPTIKNQRFIEACMGVCRVKHFEAKRLLINSERCREKLVAYSTRDAYLGMLEEVYNFGRQKVVPLKIDATIAMRERNAVQAARAKRQAKKASATT